MIKKIYTERGFMYGMTVHIIVSIGITGCTDVANLKEAIYYAVNRFEGLRCQVRQDTYGEAYFVNSGQPCEPPIEVRDYHLSPEQFRIEQERIIFKINEGELIRFVIEDLGNKVCLRIVEHHMVGDGKSVMLLADEIIANLNDIENGCYDYLNKPMIPLQNLGKEYYEENLEVSDLLKRSIMEYNELWNRQKRIFTYEDYKGFFNEYWSRNRTSVQQLKVDRLVMEDLKKLCKRNRVSINSVLLTAAAKSLKSNKKIVVVVDAKPDECKGMGNYAGFLTIDRNYDENKTFWDNVLYNHNLVHTQLAKRSDSMLAYALSCVKDCNFDDASQLESVGCLEDEVAHSYNELYNPKGNIGLVVSNLGADNVKTQYDRIQVKDLEIHSPINPNMGCSLCIATTNGVMNIIMEYAEELADIYETMLSGIEESLMQCVYPYEHIEESYCV